MSLVIHISNTDIEFDSRIRKELLALAEVSTYSIAAIGVSDNNIASQKDLDGIRLYSLSLWTRRLHRLPRAIRYFFELIEFTIRAFALARGRIRETYEGGSVAHCHDTFALPCGFFLKSVCHSKLIYDAHELESDKNGQSRALSIATLWIEKFCWRKIDLLVSVSEAIIDWYIGNFSEKQSVLILNSPLISQEPVSPSGDSKGNYFRSKFKIPQDHSVFVYLGILAPGRGIEICLDAFESAISKACIVFIGFGPLEKSIIDRATRSDKIFFHAAVPHHEVVDLVSDADFGICLIENVSLSDYLCLPNKLFEYSFAGLPILASDFPEIRRVVEKYALGICCEPTASELAKKLSELNKTQQKRNGENIFDLSWQVQAMRLRIAYSKLIGV